MIDPLRLRALDADDLAVVSAHLQDAILRVGDIAYLPKHRRFALLLNRFCWEGVDRKRGRPSKGRKFFRTLAGLHFDQVTNVQAKGFDQSDAQALLSLLAVEFDPKEDGSGVVVFDFAGGATVRVQVECIEATLSDRGASWTTPHLPSHDDAGSD